MLSLMSSLVPIFEVYGASMYKVGALSHYLEYLHPTIFDLVHTLEPLYDRFY
jgi:hypothetical protein